MRYATVLSLLAFALTCAHAQAGPFDSCPAVKPASLPALVYSENEYGIGTNHLLLAYRAKGAWQREPIVSGIYLAIEQLEGPKFLVSVGPSAQDCAHYAMDLSTGKVIPITSRRGSCPFRFERPGERFRKTPDLGKAFMVVDARGASDLELITLDYRAMTASSTSLSKDVFKTPFDSGVRMRIGPDGQNVAFLKSAKAPEGSSLLTFRYMLNVLHLSDGSVSDTDREVFVQIAREARLPFGWPAFCWFDNTTLLYQHVIPAVGAATEAECEFKTVDVNTNEITKRITKTMPLTHDGGTLYRDTDTGRFVFVHKSRETREYTVDLERNDLTPRATSAPLRFGRSGANATVQFDGKTLFEGPHFAGQVLALVSPSGKHFAYSLSTGPEVRDKARKSDLFVNVAGGPAEKLGETIYYRKPLAWIE